MSNDKIAVTLAPRKVTGKAVKHLRKEGVVPAVIHNHGKDSIIVQGDVRELTLAYKGAGRHHPVELTADGKKYTAMIKEAEFEPRKQQLVHVVFNAVDANQTVDAIVPIKPQYNEGNESSPAERNSLIVINNLDEITVFALPAKLPDGLYYNAEKLVEVGDKATVADLILPEGVALDPEMDPDQAIATVYEPSALAAANDAAGGDSEDADASAVPAAEGSVEATESEAAQKTAE